MFNVTTYKLKYNYILWIVKNKIKQLDCININSF